MNKFLTISAAALGASVVLLPTRAVADPPDYWQLSDSWRFGASMYGYLPTIAMKVTLPSGVSSDTSFSPDKILDHLKMTFMGSFEAQKGPWGGFTDVIFMNVGATPSKTRDFTIGGGQLPADVTASTSVSMKSTIWTLAGSYRAVANPESTLDVLAGARLLDIDVAQNWQLTGNVGPIPLPGRSGSGKVNVSDWDAIIGVKGRVAVSADRKWFVPYYFDVGTGETRLTWQAMGGIGYTFGWGDVIATWRYLEYSNNSDRSLRELTTNGAQLAFSFRW